MTRRHPRMCLLWIWMTTHNIKGFKTPKKGTWLSIFQPKWQNYKIVISPAGNIGSIPNFDRVIKPHRWRRGWSRITKFAFKMADGRHIANVGNAITCLSMDRLRWNLGGHIPPCPRHVRHDAVAMAMPLPSNGALYIQQLWASGGRTCEPILMRFGTQQQIRTTMTVTWSNIKILKNSKWRTAAMFENIRNAITRLPIGNGPTGTQLRWSHPQPQYCLLIVSPQETG